MLNNNKQKLELTWIGKNNPEYDIANIEPRILEENPELSNCANDPNTENMIIHGDNLLALKALLPEYEGKVKCIYIDPPYNTGNAFEHYDDNVEHSIWLSLMKPRLELLKILLKDDGVIFVQIGFDEMAYLKVLMDEVFIRSNCLGQVAVRMSHSAGMKRKAADKRIIKNTEYLLAYYKKTPPVLLPIHEVISEYPVNYYQWVVNFPTEESQRGDYCALSAILLKNFPEYFEKYELKPTNKSIHILFEREDKIKRFIFDNKDRVTRKHGEIPNIDVSDDLKSDQFIKIEADSRSYFMGKGEDGNLYQLIPLTNKVKVISDVDEDGEIISKQSITNMLGDWWDGFWRDMSRVDVEGGVKMKESKKPERLVARVFETCTQIGDLVLDSFLGSGTTTAVAHKMKRKYIGIEMGEHAYSLAKKRMDLVVSGLNHSGVSKTYSWQGGGAYKFYELAPSFIVKDEFGNPVIDDFYNDAKLIKVMCKLMNFTYKPSQSEYWKQGIGQGKNYLYVTTQLLTSGMVQQISQHLTTGESLIICPKKFEPGADKIDNRITIKKIPQSVLKACHFGKKEYLLPIKETAMEEAEIDEELEDNE